MERDRNYLRFYQIRILIVLALCLLFGSVIVIAAAVMDDRQLPVVWQRRFDASESRNTDLVPAPGEIVARSGELVDGADDQTWTDQILSGRQSMACFLQRVFVSPSYLSRQKEDDEFVRDSFWAVSGRAITIPEAEEALQLIQRNGSRLSWLQRLVEKFDQSGTLNVDKNPTQLRTMTIADRLPPVNKTVIGLLPIRAEIRLTGSGARLKLYANGLLHQSAEPDLLLDTDQANSSNVYTAYWDTRRVSAGEYELDYLILTDDGRGRWSELDQYAVPDVSMLSLGQIQSNSLSRNTLADEAGESAGQSWFVLTAEENQPMLTLFDVSGSIDLELYNIYGQKVADTTSRSGSPAALRYRGGEADLPPPSIAGMDGSDSSGQQSASYYVRAAIPADTTVDPSRTDYSLVQARTVARLTDETNYTLAVLARENDQLLLQDSAGNRNWQSAESYQTIDFDGRLSVLEIGLPDQETTGFAPEFDRENGLYGLYVSAQTDQMSLNAVAIEGSAASIQIQQRTDDGVVLDLDRTVDASIELAPSVNQMVITVTGFEGLKRVYELFVLRPPAADGYHEVLEAFPFDYRTPLWSIHLHYPQWQFEAQRTGIDWLTFLNAQNDRDKSLVDASYSPEHWVEADSPVYDGASWKAAARDVIAYFGDPRHALTPLDMFQFESLAYEPSLHTTAGVETMLQGSFMASGNPQGIDYAPIIQQAGIQAGISPYFIAAKIIQEMGLQGQSMLAHGTLPGYEGIYNYYNIGSTPNPEVENGALINGARFAQFGRDPETAELDEDEQTWLIPWNSPERAITGGAVWIAQRYVSIGQDTLYGQKFDLIADPDLFMRQYAQNIQMAWAEGRRTYRAYESMGLLDQAFVFRIPVFENLPAEWPQWP